MLIKGNRIVLGMIKVYVLRLVQRKVLRKKGRGLLVRLRGLESCISYWGRGKWS